MNAAQLIAWLRALAWVAIAVVVIMVLGRIHYTMVTFGLAGAIAYMLYPCVDWMFTKSSAFTRRQPTWGGSVLVVYLTLPILLGIVLWVSIPGISAQVETIRHAISTPDGSSSRQLEKVQAALKYWQEKFDNAKIPQGIRDSIRQTAEKGSAYVQQWVGDALGYVAAGFVNFFYGMLLLIVALIISQFMLLNLPDMRRAFYESLPERYRDEIRGLLHEVNFVFGGFIKGTVILSILAATAVFLLLNGLSLLAWVGVPRIVPFDYSLALAILTLVLYPIPLLGLIGITLISAFAAYVQDGSSATYVIIVLTLVVSAFTTVDRVVGPRVMSQAMGVSPLFVMFAALAGAELTGFWGMILGVPVAAAIKVLFRYVRSRFLVPQEGDPSVASMVIRESQAMPVVPKVDKDKIKAPDHAHSTVAPISKSEGTVETAKPETSEAPATDVSDTSAARA